jgi:RND family efflux transporter MFP subunit
MPDIDHYIWTFFLKTRSYLILFLPFAALLAVSCGGNDAQRPGGPGGPGGWPGMARQATSVEVTEVTTSSISDQVRSYGTIRAQDVVTIIPQVSNRITRIHADLGDTVRQGQLLAKIHDVPFRDALEQAEAQLRQAQASYVRDSTAFDRQQQLFDRGASSPSELDNARSAFAGSKAQYESARAALTQSRENLENTDIRSPVNGVVLSRMIAEGDLARTGDPAFEVANLVGFETRLFLPMHEWESVTVGLPVTMRLSNRDEMAAHGIISRISPQLNPNTGLGEVVVSLTDATRSVRQGVLVDSRITLRTHENTVVIPRSAMIEQVETYIEPETNTVEIRRKYNAFVAVGDTIARQRELELGLEQGERVEVVAGLEAGEKLITTGHRNLSDRDRIRIAGQSRPGTREQRMEDGLTDTATSGSEVPSRRRPDGEQGGESTDRTSSESDTGNPAAERQVQSGESGERPQRSEGSERTGQRTQRSQ